MHVHSRNGQGQGRCNAKLRCDLDVKHKTCSKQSDIRLNVNVMMLSQWPYMNVCRLGLYHTALQQVSSACLANHIMPIRVAFLHESDHWCPFLTSIPHLQTYAALANNDL